MKARKALALVAFLIALQVAAFCQSSPESQPCRAKPDWYSQIQKPDSGWDVAIVDRGQKMGTSARGLSTNPSLKVATWTEYALLGKYFAFTEVVVDSCTHKATLRTQHLLAEHAYGVSYLDRTFALVLSGNCGILDGKVWEAAGCKTSITLIDTTGSGKFDLMMIGHWAPDSIPDWVTQSSKTPEQNQ
jgi:hypothetical protein